MSSDRPSSNDFEKKQHASLNDKNLLETDIDWKMLRQKLFRYCRNKYNWNLQDIEDTVSETIKITFENVKNGKIRRNINQAAKSNLRTVINKNRDRKQVNGKRNYLSRVTHLSIDGEAESNFHVQKALGEKVYCRPEESLLEEEGKLVLKDASDKVLKPSDTKKKVVFDETVINGNNHKAVAQQLNISENNVSKIKQRLLKKMKRPIEDYFKQ